MKRRIIRDNEKLRVELFQEIQDVMEENIREMFLLYLGELGHGLVNTLGLNIVFTDERKEQIKAVTGSGAVYLDGERVGFSENVVTPPALVKDSVVSGKEYYRRGGTVPAKKFVYVAPVDVKVSDSKADQGYFLLTSDSKLTGAVVPVVRLGEFSVKTIGPQLLSQEILPEEQLSCGTIFLEGREPYRLPYVYETVEHVTKLALKDNQIALTPYTSFECKKLVFSNEERSISWFEHKHLETKEDPSRRIHPTALSGINTANFKDNSIQIAGNIKIVFSVKTVTGQGVTLAEDVQSKLVLLSYKDAEIQVFTDSSYLGRKLIGYPVTQAEAECYVYEIVLEQE